MSEPNTYSRTWHGVFGATQRSEATDREIAFLARMLPLPRHQAVLDVCCGRGRHLAGLSARGYVVTGVERDPAVAQEARQTAPAAQVIEGDATRLADLIEGTFGGVICMWQSFGYGTPQQNAALLEVFVALLGDEGRLVLDVNNRAFHERRAGVRIIERAGRTIREESFVEESRQTIVLDYGDGETDIFSWQLYTADELIVLGNRVGLALVLACAAFDERAPVTPDRARMQLVFERS